MPHEQPQLNLVLLALMEKAPVCAHALAAGYAAFLNDPALRFGDRDVRTAFTRSRRIGDRNLAVSPVAAAALGALEASDLIGRDR